MSASNVAELSVVIVAPSGGASIKRTIGCLRAQTAADRIEVLVVAPSASQVDPAGLGASCFGAFRTIEAGPITRRAAAAVEGIRAATAPVVSLLENHCFPEPGWAAALLAAHREPWAGVGPHVENANPGAAISRVSFWLSFAAISGPQPAGKRNLLPWHNTAYKHEVLTGYGDRLPELLDWEGNLQADLLATGHELYFEPAARTHHVNASAMRSAVVIHFLHGRAIAGQRSDEERWPRWRRALHTAAAPLLPFMYMHRLAPEFRRLGVDARAMLEAGPAFIVLLTATAIGEATGYIAGAGDAISRFADYDLWREAHMSRRDRWMFEEVGVG